MLDIDVTDLVVKANQFEHLATIDGLTGLYNRRHFDNLGEAEWQRFQRYFRSLSLILIDIDQFKEINDRLGHEVGDEALKAVASVCVESKRSTDIGVSAVMSLLCCYRKRLSIKRA